MFLPIFQQYKKGDYIYPGALIRHLDISMNEIYEALEVIKELGVIRPHYEVYCKECRKFTGISYETINNMPEYVECEQCENPLDPIVDCIVFYKVVADE